MNKDIIVAQINRKTAIVKALIALLGTIIAAIIGVFNYNLNNSNEILEQQNTELSEQNKDWEIAYNEVNEQLEELNNQNISLSNEINTLEDSMEQYSSLAGENESLKSEISELKKEIQTLKDNESSENNERHELETEGNNISDSNRQKVSIFDLDTFQGHTPWEIPFDESDYTDTYGNKYVTAHIGRHESKTRNAYDVPTYLLDNKYTICEGQIAWSKRDKNEKHSAWIEFYSGEDLIYTSDIITPTDRVVSFSFPVDGLETLTIVTNSTCNYIADCIHIIYPYLNLIE